MLPDGVGIFELRLPPPTADLAGLLARAPVAPPSATPHPAGTATRAEVRYPAQGAVQHATLIAGQARALCSLTGDVEGLAAHLPYWRAVLDSLRFLRELDGGFPERVADALVAAHPQLSASALGSDRVRVSVDPATATRSASDSALDSASASALDSASASASASASDGSTPTAPRVHGTWWLRDLLREVASAPAEQEAERIAAACAAFDPAALRAPPPGPTVADLFPALYAADDPQASETLTRLVAPWLRAGVHAANALRPQLLGPVQLAPLGLDVDAALEQALRNLEEFVAEVPLSGSEGDDGRPELLDFSGFAYLGAAFLMPSFPARAAAALGPECQFEVPARDVLLAYRSGNPKLAKHVRDTAERTRTLSLEPLPAGTFAIQGGKARPDSLPTA